MIVFENGVSGNKFRWGPKGGALVMGLVPLSEETQLSLSLCHMRSQQEGDYYEPEKDNPTSTLTLDF